MSTEKEGVFEMPVMSIKDLQDFSKRFEKYQIQQESHDAVNNEKRKTVEINGEQVEVGTTAHINAALGKTGRKNSKQFLLNSSHQDLFADNFDSSHDKDHDKEKEVTNNNDNLSESIFSKFNDVSVNQDDNGIEFIITDKEGDVFGVNFPSIDDSNSLVALSVCNVDNLSNMSDDAFESKLESVGELIDKIKSDSLAEGKKEHPPVYGAFESDFTEALNEIAENDAYLNKRDETVLRYSEGLEESKGYSVAVHPNSRIAKEWDKKWGNQHDSEIPDKDAPKFGVTFKTMETKSLGEDDKHPIIIMNNNYQNGRNSFQKEFANNITEYMMGKRDDDLVFKPKHDSPTLKTKVAETKPEVGLGI